MLSKYSKFILFLLAYLPLFLILSIQFSRYFQNMWIFGIILVLSVYILTKCLFNSINKMHYNKRLSDVEIKESKSVDMISFLVTYLFPFVPSQFDIYSLISSIIIFLLIVYFYIHSDLFVINPLMKVFFKYELYLGTEGNGKIFFLSKNKYKMGKYTIKLKPIIKNLYIEVEEENEKN